MVALVSWFLSFTSGKGPTILGSSSTPQLPGNLAGPFSSLSPTVYICRTEILALPHRVAGYKCDAEWGVLSTVPMTLCIQGAAIWSVVSRPQGPTHTCQFLNTSLAPIRHWCPLRCFHCLVCSGCATWSICYPVGDHLEYVPWLFASLLLLARWFDPPVSC